MAPLLPLVTPIYFDQFVAVPGTGEAFAADETYARKIVIQAGKAGAVNAGNIYIGVATVDATAQWCIALTPGTTYEFDIPEGCIVDLNDIYVDAINAADGVRGWYYPPVTVI